MGPNSTSPDDEDVPPVWLATLARQLRAGGKDAPPDILSPLAALDELVETSHSVIAGRGEIPRADRISLKEDLALALADIGPHLTDAVKADLRAFQGNDLAKLPNFLGDVEGARRLAIAATALTNRFTGGAAVRAAWTDVRSAFRELGIECGL